MLHTILGTLIALALFYGFKLFVRWLFMFIADTL